MLIDSALQPQPLWNSPSAQIVSLDLRSAVAPPLLVISEDGVQTVLRYDLEAGSWVELD
jgi:hypothetical protein